MHPVGKGASGNVVIFEAVNRNKAVVNFVNEGEFEVETNFLVRSFSTVCIFVLSHSVAKKV